ncbi:WD repeat and HMG-box DNA-binding protein 1 [Plutella xylostella]|uniref:WD repeat and HMG-box DNA-binding protein 1 n=1 Tax=Plutella xylostella TaxID=51655 RepID=UPI002032C61B|nr:WD repeat and HMG-box DNA-binding protein 1 [Plutella xylostella]
MKIESKPLRYAHAEGHTDLCYTDDGKHIITCGHDGDVRIWVDIEDDDPNSHCVGESALAVCYKDKRLYVATDNHAVQAYTFPAFDKDGIVTRFTAPVTQIMSSGKIEALGCSSENMEAKICSPEGGAPLFVMADHKGPVLSIAVCPQMKYACTACGDGNLRVWDIDTQKVVSEVSCVPKINTFYAAKVLCRMDFEPKEGKYLAYPSNREVVILDTETWGQRMTFTHSSIKCAISQCRFSPCGEYLAASTVAGQIAVWGLLEGNCIGVIEHPTSHNVSALAWNPKGNGVIAYCDVAGQLGMLVNCCGKETMAAQENMDTIEMIERDNDNDDIVDNLIENYESDDDNAISLEKLKNETLGLAVDEDSRGSRAESRGDEGGSRGPRGVPPQPPFQPSATPTHLEHRYMCWNEVGIVRCHTQENGESTIDVEFHDAGVHHGIHLNNYLNHTMASLSTTVLVLACETPSKLVCISLVGSSKEWSVSLPRAEEARCVAAAAGLLACATDARLLRLYTPRGTQRQVISLAGPVVALAGFNTTILAVYHSSEPGPTDQHLAMDIIAMNGHQIRTKTVPVPLTPGSRLTWLGCSDSGSPCTADSSGTIRLYHVASAVWMPICCPEYTAESNFVVSVSESTQTVRAIVCRGASFPPTVPKPIVSQIPIQMPLCELDTEKGQYEEQLVRWAHIAADVDVKTARETALKLFALACRSEIEQRALELMELLRDDRLLPLAAKYASRLGRMHLAEKLTDLSETWERETDKLNVAQNSHFHELDTQETYDTAAADDAVNSSLIIPQRVKEKKAETVTPIKPVPIKSSPGGARNPFKKQRDASRAAHSPLSLTERNLVELDSTQEVGENLDPLKPNAGETFVDWFSRNKAILEQQNADLTPSELTRQGIKTFKTLQTKPSEVASESSQKRKLEDQIDDTPPVTNAPKQSKLSAFAFQKKT